MALTPGESDRLQLFLQGQLARARRERGLRLNVPEATAYIADAVCEWARDGVDLPAVRERARQLLTVDDVLPEVPHLLDEVRVEARFDDGTRLVVVRELFSMGARQAEESPTSVADGSITIRNEATTAIALSSHIHLAEENPRLRLDRAAAFGRRLALPAGATIWIRPGEVVTAAITPIRGNRTVTGTTGVIDGPLDDPDIRARALAALRRCGYLDIIDGTNLNDVVDAESAVSELMNERRGRP